MDSRIVEHPSQNRLGENCFPEVFLHFEKKMVWKCNTST